MLSKASDPSQVPATRWYLRPQQAWLRRPALRTTAAYWVQLEGSLTRALKSRCQHSFHVEVVNEVFARPTREEAQALDVPYGQYAWIREVRLCGDNAPWVLARTVIPLITLKGDGRRFRHLGRTPLGTWLFSHRQWHRSAFQTGLCKPGPEPGPAFARRSVFYREHRRLLVSEYFLPALLTGRGNRPGAS